jgi:hypothetical protein
VAERGSRHYLDSVRFSVIAALVALLVLPAAASADQVTFGSSLAGTPDIEHNQNKADTIFFNVSPQNSHQSPVSGQILAVRVKGAMNPRAGIDEGNKWNVFHTQVLHPNAGGTYTVDSSSQTLNFPTGGPVDEVHTFVPSTQCIKQGEFVAFNHFGGWNNDPRANGAQYQIFKRDGASQLNWYERDQGTNNGTTFTPNQQRDTAGNLIFSNGFQPNVPLQEELMMQVVVGTGFDSSNLCEGGQQGYEYAGVLVTKTTFTVYDDGVAGARLGCTSGRDRCEGTARLSIDGAEIGSAPFKLDRNVTTNLDIPLTPEGARLVGMRGTADATVTTDSRDGIGQQRTTTGVATLKSARPITGGFAGLVVRAQSAAVKGNGFNITATCPLATLGACTGSVSISSQKRVPLRRGSRGKVYKMASGKFTVQPGQKVRVPLKLTSSGKKVLKKVKKVVTIATVTSSEQGSAPVSKRSKVTLKKK